MNFAADSNFARDVDSADDFVLLLISILL